MINFFDNISVMNAAKEVVALLNNNLLYFWHFSPIFDCLTHINDVTFSNILIGDG